MQDTVRSDRLHMSLRALCQRILLICLVLFGLTTLAACSATAGVLAGGTWQSAGLPHQHIRILAVDANNPQNIYAGDEEGQVFTSSDGGQHWIMHSVDATALKAAPAAVHALSFDASGKKLYAATDHGIFVSTDAAQHWHNVGAAATGLPPTSYEALAFDLNAVHTMYAASKTAVLVSQNDGQSWTTISQNLPSNGFSINSLTFDTDSHFLWAATSTGIYRYATRSATWQALNDGLPGGIFVYAVQPASTSGGASGLIFAGTKQGFYRSVDSGVHWEQSQQSLARTNVRSLLVDFRQPKTVYVGTDIGVLRSDDSGQSWSGIASGLPRNQPVYALELGANNYAQLFAANDGVYLFPGSSGGLSITNLLPFLLVLLLFYLLYRLTSRNRKGKQKMLKPERMLEQPTPVTGSDRPGTDHVP